ncbi:MAG: ribonuclease III [Planctomycetes bacterium]|nr:ribonuclease III [Planctomycetota bacterium]
MKESNLGQLEELLGYQFKDQSLLVKAMTHSSLADNRSDSNERLEFFGDAILDLVICETLFERFPQYQEGDLTKIKSMLVSRKTCSRVAMGLDFSRFAKVGKGMEKTRAMAGSISAGIFEAIVAAIYLDGGQAAAREFILRLFNPLINKANSRQHHENFKSLLQQHCQRRYSTTPDYLLLDEKGPDHNKCFEIGIVIEHRHFPTAWGVTKKDAEQKAAFMTLVELGVLEPEEPAEE